ncbi:permease [Aeromicrobium sp. P5_D10]
MALAAMRWADANQIGWLNNFLLVFVGLLLEAAPFVLLGALVSSGIEVWASPRIFERLARAPRAAQVAVASCGGLIFPVCECGSVPVARRLMSKGLAPAAAITFMLAAPIVNPVVIFSTWFAFKGQGKEFEMVSGRIIIGIVVAVIVGAVVSRTVGTASVRDFLGSRIGVESSPHQDEAPSLERFTGHASAEFVAMMRFMMVGALIVATLQTVVPQTLLTGFAGTAIVAIPAMMLLAFLLALCSESDAILVSSFTQFSSTSQLAFLVFGPMLDVKLVALYVGSFGRRAAMVLCATITVTTLAVFLWLEVIGGML